MPKSLDKICKCCIFAACLEFNNNKKQREMKSKTMTLEEFAEFINAKDLWELNFDDDIYAIIVANGWIPIFDEWRICHDDKNMIYFDDRGIAKITPIEL